MKKIIYLFLGLLLAIGITVYAAPTVNYQQSIFPITTNTYSLGTSTRQWLNFAAQNASTTNFSISGGAWQTGLDDCDNGVTSKVIYDSAAGAFTCGTDTSGSGTTVSLQNAYNGSTSSPEFLLNNTIGGITVKDASLGTNLFEVINGSGSLLFGIAATSTTMINASTTAFSIPSGGFFNLNATGTMQGGNICTSINGACGAGGGSGTVTSVDMSVPTGLTISGNPITTSGTLALTFTSGYNIPLTASTTNWDSFFAVPSSRITDGTGLTWSSNTLNCDTASGSVQGCLASADWTTFNNKLGSGGSITSGTITNASTTYLSIATNGWLNSNPIVSNVTGSQTQLAAFSGTNTITPTSSIGFSMINGIGNMAGQSSSAVTITGGTITGITDLTVADGGTGASTLTGLLSGNGTGAITGGATINNDNWSGTDLTVSNGGTGASTLSGFLYGNGASAFTGTTTPYFSLGFYAGATSTMNGSNICTAANGACPSGSGTPGGANTQVQFNDSDAFGGNAGFTFDKTGTKLTVTNASTTAFSVSSGGFFNLNATGTMQGFALCTAGNGACGSAGASATVTASEEIWNCVPQTDSTGFAPGGAFIDVLGENLLAIHQMNATSSAIYCRWHIPDDIAASPSAVIYTNFAATTSGNLAIDLYATTTPPDGGNYGPFGAWTTIKAGSTSPVTLNGGSAYQSTSTTSPISLTLTAGHDLIIRMIRWGEDADDTVENAAFFIKSYVSFLRKVN